MARLNHWTHEEGMNTTQIGKDGDHEGETKYPQSPLRTSPVRFCVLLHREDITDPDKRCSQLF
jgi:hypothetical protein